MSDPGKEIHLHCAILPAVCDCTGRQSVCTGRERFLSGWSWLMMGYLRGEKEAGSLFFKKFISDYKVNIWSLESIGKNREVKKHIN